MQEGTDVRSSQLTVHGVRKGNTIHYVRTIRYGTHAAEPASLSGTAATGLVNQADSCCSLVLGNSIREFENQSARLVA